MSDRVISFSIKPHDHKAIKLVKEVKRVAKEKCLPSFSYVLLQALEEYMAKHHDDTN